MHDDRRTMISMCQHCDTNIFVYTKDKQVSTIPKHRRPKKKKPKTEKENKINFHSIGKEANRL